VSSETPRKRAYEESRAEQANDDPPEVIPTWEALPLAMRIASSMSTRLGFGSEERKNASAGSL